MRLDRALLREPVTLQLHIEAVAEDLAQRFEAGAGELGIAGGKSEVDRPVGSAGERDQAVRMRGEGRKEGDHLPRLGGGEIGDAR